jgi:hypothetical protein
VIIFTHDVWFVSELLERFQDSTERCAYYEVLDQPDTGAIVKGRELGRAPALEAAQPDAAPFAAS